MKAKIGSRPTRFDFKTTALAAALAPLAATAGLAETGDRVDFPPVPSGEARVDGRCAWPDSKRRKLWALT